MGIDTDFRRLLEAKYDACFGDGPIPQNKGLLVVDLLTTAFSAIGPRFNYTFTGDEFVRFVFDHASAGFDGSQIKTCVITADLQEWVPKEKETEQKKRSRSNAHQPYPDTCKFERTGILLPGQQEDAQPFDLRRVVCNRKLREVLWRFTVTELQARACVPPRGCTFVFDHFPEGAYCFDLDGWWLDQQPNHTFGEADLKMPCWLGRFERSPTDMPTTVVVQSIDSDLLLILLLFAHNMKDSFRHKLILRYWKGKWVDIGHLRRTINQDKQMPWNIPELVMVILLGGSDFIDKSMFLEGFGATKIFNYMLKAKPGWLLGATREPRDFARILRFLYGTKMGLIEDGATELPKLSDFWRMKRKQTTTPASYGVMRLPCTMPSAEDIRRASKAIQFNFRYWNVDWVNAFRKAGMPVRDKPAGHHCAFKPTDKPH